MKEKVNISLQIFRGVETKKRRAFPAGKALLGSYQPMHSPPLITNEAFLIAKDLHCFNS